MKKSLSSLCLVTTLVASPAARPARAAFDDPGIDRVGLPKMAPGFKVEVIAREPVVRNPVTLAFDRRGRLFVGGGPQYRRPSEKTPGDSVHLLLDSDGDGVYEKSKTFATGFNSIQSIAWKGRDLWIANAPDLTVVRDLDGDDEADEYVLVYSGIATLEHGLHGLTWAPDGKLYMSKGDTPVQADAPLAFRKLQHITSAAPATQPIRVFRKGQYKKTWVFPMDGHIEGGVLRCDDMGKNLEIFARGLRNPYDITFDDGFDWLGTDNDSSTEGDRIFMPFRAAHFGHRHPWSNSWTGEDHPQTAPISGPTFDGSGVGMVFSNGPHFPAPYQGVYFIGDWHRRVIYVYRPKYQGPLVQSTAPKLEEIAQGGSTMFRPTDLEHAPDGSLLVTGWGSLYGAKWVGKDGKISKDSADPSAFASEGRLFRITHTGAPVAARATWDEPKRQKPYAAWTTAELVADLATTIPAWRVNAQDELVRRGATAGAELLALLDGAAGAKIDKAQETWIAWALGRMTAADRRIEAALLRWAGDARRPNLRRQAFRILAHRAGGKRRLPSVVTAALRAPDARLRFEAVQAIGAARDERQVAALEAFLTTTKPDGPDRLAFFSAWRALHELQPIERRRAMLRDGRPAVRYAGLLGLLEAKELAGDEVLALSKDPSPLVRELASDWLGKAGFGLTDPGAILALLEKHDNRNTNYELRLNLLRALAAAQLAPNHWEFLHARFYAPWRNRDDEVVPEEKSQEIAAALEAMSRPVFAKRTLPVLWDALDHPWPLVREAAAAHFPRLEAAGRAYLLDKLPGASGQRLWGALTALGSFPRTGPGWPPDEAIVKALARAYEATKDPRQRRLVVELLRGADATRWKGHPARATALAIGRKAAADPDPRVHGQVEALGARLGERLAVTAVPRKPASLTAVLARLGKADPRRGREIFFDASRANCFACHKLDDLGQAAGPDLSDLGLRTDARYIVESILDPSATIIEGFKLTGILLEDGRQLEGMVHDETDRSLRLIGADGRETAVAKRAIKERATSEVSLMPSGFETILSDDEVADLTAFLLAQKRRRAAFEVGAMRGASAFSVSRVPGKLVVSHRGKPLTNYYFGSQAPKPFLHPLRAPSGLPVSRGFPVEPLPGEPPDHLWHRGIWIAHGDVNGIDFWREKTGDAKKDAKLKLPIGSLVPATEPKVTVARDAVSIAGTFELRGPDGKTIGRLGQELVLRSLDGHNVVDARVTVHAPAGAPLRIGDTEEGFMGVRMTEEFREDRGCAITNSEGAKGTKAVWGKRARWVDYTTTREGQQVGVLMLDHPSNPKHPAYWHARGYGLCAINPFGERDFTGDESRDGGVTIQPGKTLSFRYRVLVHDGALAPAQSEALYEQFAKSR